MPAPWQVLIAHSEGEEDRAEEIARPLEQAGYSVVHEGRIYVGESLNDTASSILNAGNPLVVCATARTIGTTWARRLVNAARHNYRGVRVFVLQMEEDADAERLALDSKVSQYWQDPARSIKELIEALNKHFSLDEAINPPNYEEAEERFKQLALESCDIIDLANLPDDDRHIATRRLELRRLYVALRVSVEVPTSNLPSDKSWEDALKKIELQRDAIRQGRHFGERKDRIPVGTRLNVARQLVILGDPGSGKTTLLRWIATAYLLKLKADPEWKDLPDVATLPNFDWLPIFIRCRDLDKSCLEGALDDVLQHTLRKSEMTLRESLAIQPLLRERLKQGSAILLIDGLDEITDTGLRARFCEQLERINIAYPNAPMIVTSRIVGYREAGHKIGRGFEHATVSDLARSEKDDFARRWCSLTERPERQLIATQELIRDIHSADRVERLTGNPMLLTTMALVKRKVGKLPSRRHDLYGEAVQVLLNWRSEVDQPLDVYEAIPQLEYLAYFMCEKGVQSLRRDEIIEVLTEMRLKHPHLYSIHNRTPSDFLKALEGRTGILIQSGEVSHLGMYTPVYEFRHLTFQEYMAARALVDRRYPGHARERSLPQAVAAISKQLFSSDSQGGNNNFTENWREALRLVVAMCQEDYVDDTLLAIFNPTGSAGPASINHTLLALSCLSDETNVSAEIANIIISEFVAIIPEIADVRSGIYLNGWNALASLRDLAHTRWEKPTIDLILRAFSNSDTLGREIYSDALALFQSSFGHNYEYLERVLIDEKPLSYNETVLFSSNIAACGYSKELRERLRLVDCDRLSEFLLNMLCQKGDPSFTVATALHIIIKHISDEEPIWIPKPEQLDVLCALVGDSSLDKKVRDQCVKVIAETEDMRCFPQCLQMLSDIDPATRYDAAFAINCLCHPDTLAPLLILYRDSVEEVRAAAKVGIVGLEPSQTVRALREWLDGDESLWQPATEALHEIAVRVFMAHGPRPSKELFKLCLKRRPTDAIRNNLAFCHILDGFYKEALAEIESMDAQELPRMEPLWLNNKALAQFKEGMTEAAKTTFQVAQDNLDSVTTQYGDNLVILILEYNGDVAGYSNIPLDVAIALNMFMTGCKTEDDLHQILERYGNRGNEFLQIVSSP